MQTLCHISLPSGGSTVLLGAEGGGPADPVALVLPAMGVPAAYYGPFVDELGRQGVGAAVGDYPGQGQSLPEVSRGVDYGYRELAQEWMPAILAATHSAFPSREVVLLGHSLGGHVMLAYLAHVDDPKVRAGILVGSGSPYWMAQGKNVGVLAKTQVVAAVTRVRGMWPGHRFGFGGRQPRTLMAEWAGYARHGRLEPGGKAVEDDLHDVTLPVLAIDLDGDTLCPPSATDHLVAKLTGAPVDRWTFAKSPGDPGKPVDHFSFARSPEIIGAYLADWARATASLRE